jgi:hypothetical protein
MLKEDRVLIVGLPVDAVGQQTGLLRRCICFELLELIYRYGLIVLAGDDHPQKNLSGHRKCSLF